MTNEVVYGMPLLLIMALSVVMLLVDAFTGKNKIIAYYFSIFSLLVVAASAALTISPDVDPGFIETPMSGTSMVFGGYAAFFDIIFCVAGILTIFASRPYLKREYGEYKEYYSLILFAITGMMLISHSNSLLMLFIGIELMSIVFYVLSGFIRTRVTAVESALKYFLLGSFASGFLLYGMALLYGATGTIVFPEILKSILSGSADMTFIRVGFALILIGLAFKAAAFPFHQWAPDVYHGAPTVSTAFMSTAGKAAALIAFIIVAKAIIPTDIAVSNITDVTIKLADFTDTSRMIIAIIAALTMLIGNISAVVQKNVKRMLAYSSVAHAGYLMMGIVANNENGWSGIMFYATAYMFMQIGSFVIVGVIERNNERMNFEDYSGLRKNHPWLAALMAIFMFSLAGIPPFAGFPGKYMLFVGAVESGFTWLTIVAVVSTIISMYFYIGLVLNMYFKDNDNPFVVTDISSARITLAISVIFVFLLGILPNSLIELAKQLF
ncbi:MAG: NADH-quinone oxidoreductase subunit N [Candidatus Kapabacteria bacterium]|nr:NADH-quinone oxidoreductase subunit N [Ignavibacteriota bacterium]MCW5884923.1 NADH-quinone oxidoreductase subunit N [Candidatus Kapabacteria bacterium]